MPTFFFADPFTSSLMQLRFEGDTQAWQVINHTSTQKGGGRQGENGMGEMHSGSCLGEGQIVLGGVSYSLVPLPH
jgi:hypothetical protein